jgi:hypothetical protein
MTSSSGLRGHRRTYLTILKSADHTLFKMVRYVLLRPLRPELVSFKNNYQVRKREFESMTLAKQFDRVSPLSVKRGRQLEEPIVMHKSELPLNVNNYYKIVVISEIFLIVVEIQNRKFGRRIIIKSMTR